MNELPYIKFTEESPLQVAIPDKRKITFVNADSPSPASPSIPNYEFSKSLQKVNSKNSRENEESVNFAENQIAKLLKKFYKSQTLEKFTSFVNWVESEKTFTTQKIYANLKDFKFFPNSSSNIPFEQNAEVISVAISPDSKHFALALESIGVHLWDFKKMIELGSFDLASTEPGIVFRVTMITMSDEYLFSGGWDSRIIQWNIRDRTIVHEFTNGHLAPILSLKVDSNILVSSAEENHILIWDLNSYECKRLEGHKSPVSSLILSYEKDLLISASWDKTIKIWRLSDLHLEASLEGHCDIIRAIAVSSDFSLLASGGDDRQVKIWDLNDKKEKKSFDGHHDIITTISFSPDGGLVVSGSFDKTLKVWNVRKMEIKKTLEGHTDHIKSMVISADGKKIITGGADLSMRVWAFDKDYEKHLLQGHKMEVLAIAVFPDNSRAISGGKEKSLRVWDLNKIRPIFDLVEHDDIIIILAVSSNSNWMSSGDKGGRVIMWDTKFYNKYYDEKLFPGKEVLFLKFISEGANLVSGGSDGTVKLINIGTKQIEKTFTCDLGTLAAFEITPNVSYLLAAPMDCFRFVALDLMNYSFKKVCNCLYTGGIITIMKSCWQNGDKAVTVHSEGILTIWDLTSFRISNTILTKNDKILSMDITRDNLTIVTGHLDSSIHLFDLETGAHTGIMESVEPVWTLALSYDNAKLLSSSGSSFAIKIIMVNKIKTMQLFKHHKNAVKALVLSHDQNLLAAGSSDNTISLWDLKTMEYRVSLEGHVSKVLAIRFSPDDKKLVSGGSDHTIRVWNLENSTCLSVLKKVGGWISDLVLTSDGSRAIVGCSDKTVNYFDLSREELLHQYSHSAIVECVVLSQDDELSYSGDKSGFIIIYDLIGRKEIGSIKAHQASVNALAIYENNNNVKLISGGSDTFIKIWNLSNPHLNNHFLLIEVLIAHTSPVLSMAINSKASKLFSSSKDKSILMWDINNYKQIAELDGHHSAINCLTLAKNSKSLYSGSDDKSIRVWNLNDSRNLPFLDGHSQSITKLAITPDNNYLLSGGNDKIVIIWDLQNKNQKGLISGLDGKITGLAISSDGKWVVVGTDGQITGLWDLESRLRINYIEYHLATCCECILGLDNQKIFIGYSDSIIRLWDLKRKEIEKTFEGHSGFVGSLILDKYGDKLISGSDDQTVIVWSVHTAQKIIVLSGHEKEVTALCLNWDGSVLYTGSHDKKVIAWDTNLGYPKQVIQGHKNPITSMKISGDNQFLIVGCSMHENSTQMNNKKKNIYVWAIKNFQLAMMLDLSILGCTSILFSTKGDSFFTATKEKSIHLWKYPSFTLSKTLKGHSLNITAETISQDTSLIIMADDSLIITVWDLSTSKRAACFEGHTGLINALIITKDNTILSASSDKIIAIWGIQGNRLLARLQGHTAAVNAIALSYDETLLISSSDDHSIRLWDFLLRLQIRRYDTKTDIIKALYMNLDNKTFLSGGKEKKIALWNVESEWIKPQNMAIVNAGVESITMSPNQSILIIFLSSHKMQIWDVKNFTLMSEFNCPQFRSLPVFLSKSDNRLIMYFDKLIDCFTGEVIFTFQSNQEILSFFFDFKKNLYIYLSNSFQLLQFNVNWLATYLFKYLNYDSLSVLSKDPAIICNRKMSCFPFFFSFLHLISIFDKTDFFTMDKLREINDWKNSEILRSFYAVDMFLNTPLDILIQRKNTTLIVKYFKMLFIFCNDKSASFYQKSRFFNYNFREDYNLPLLLNDLTSLLKEDLAIFFDLFNNSMIPFDPSIYDNSLVYRELDKPVFIETDSLYTNDANYIEYHLKQLKKNKKNDEKNEIEENKSMIKAKIICLPNLNNINLEKVNDFYGVIANLQAKNELFNNKVLGLLVQYIWDTQIAFYYKIELIVFLFFFLLFNFNFLYLYQMRGNIYLYESSSLNHATTIIDILIIVNSLYTLINELKQMAQGIQNYFKYIWNYNDIALIITAISTALLDISLIYIPSQREDWLPEIKLVFSFSMFCFWFRFLSFFRALKETSSMIRLIFNVIAGVKYFVFFMILFMLALSTSFYMLHEDVAGEFPDLWSTILIFYVTTTGDSSGITDYDLILTWMAEFYLIVATFLFAIMLMNLLVSIIGDNHNDIKDSEHKTRLYELVNILVDTNSSMTTQIAKKFFPPKKMGTYLIQLYNDKHEVEVGNIYEELEKDISSEVSKMVDGTNLKIKEIKEKIVGFEKGNQHMIEELREEMKKNKEDIKKMMSLGFAEITKYLEVNKNKKEIQF